MSSLIEFPLTSPCPAHRDAILSWVVEGSESGAVAVAAKHAKACNGCKQFRDSLKMQRSLVHKDVIDAKAQESAGAIRHVRDLTHWIDKELSKRSEAAVALDLWKVAESLLREDADVNRHTFSENPNDPASTRSELKFSASSWEFLKHINFETRLRSKLRSMGNETASFLSLRRAPLTPFDRASAIRALTSAGIQLSENVRGLMSTVLSNLEWFLGDSGLVPKLHAEALNHAMTAPQRAHAIANIALWQSSRFEYRNAITTGELALKCCDKLVFPRVNLSVWMILDERPRESRDHLVRAAKLIGVHSFRNRWPWNLMQGWLKIGLDGLGLEDRGGSAIASLWNTYRFATDCSGEADVRAVDLSGGTQPQKRVDS
jgi:hypothetical protein